MRRFVPGLAITALVATMVLAPAVSASAAVVTVETPADGARVVAGTIVFGGSTDMAPAPVSVYYAGEVPVCTDPAPAAGSWSCAGDLPPGAYAISIMQVDPDTGVPVNDSSTLTVAPPAPTVNGAASIPQGTDLAVNGDTGYTGASLVVSVAPGGVSCTPTIAGTSWACTLDTSALAPGAYSVEVVSTVAGVDSDPSTLDFTITPPAGPTPPTITGPSLVAQGANAFPGGYADPGATVDAAVVDAAPAITCSTTAGALDGYWQCPLDVSDLPLGDYAFSAVATVGGVASTTTTQPFSIAPPVSATIECSFGPGGQTSIQSGPDTIAGVWSVDGTGETDIMQPGECGGLPGTIVTEYGPPIALDTSCADGCEFPTLEPGLYEVYYFLSDSNELGSNFEPYDWFFTIPEAPTLEPVTSAGATVTASGTAVPGNEVVFERTDGGALCTATAEPDGGWSCDFPLPTQLFLGRAYQTDAASGGVSGYSADEGVPADAISLTSPSTTEPTPWQPGSFLQIAGTVAELSSTISVDLDGSPVPGCAGIVPAPDSTWACPDPIAVTPGNHLITVTETLGATSSFETFAFTVSAAPTPTVNGATQVLEGDDFEVFGDSAVFNTTVTAQVVGTTITCDSEVTGESTAWGCILPTGSLPIGEYEVTATSDDGEQVYGPSEPFAFSIVEEVAGSDAAITCDFAPGQVRITAAPGTQAATYALAPGTGAIVTDPLGDCGGVAGWVPPSPANFGEYTLLQNCDPTCLHTDLPPGTYNVYYGASDSGGGDGGSEGFAAASVGPGPFDWFFTIPAPPAAPAVTRTGTTAVANGTDAVPGNTVVLEGPDGAPLCSGVAGATGSWSCSFAVLSAAGVGRTYQVDQASGGVSAYGPALTLPFSLPTLPQPPAVVPRTPAVIPPAVVPPTAPLMLPIEWVLGMPGGLDKLRHGDALTFTSSGLPAGTTVVITMYSTPIELLRTVVDGGPATFRVTVPDGIEDGAHRIEFVATAPDGQVLLRDTAAIVIPPDAEKAVAGQDIDAHPDKDPTALAVAAGGRNDLAAPSALSESIPTLTRLWEYPLSLGLAAGLAIALLFLVAVPTELLNSTLSSNTGRLGRGFIVVERALDRARDRFIAATRSRALAAGITVLVVSTIFGFVDPKFGFDLVSVRLVLALAIAFFLLSYGASWITGAIMRRRYATHSVIQVQPSIIVFAILGVIVARLIEFSPGFLVGIVIGLELVRASRRASLAATVIQLGVVVALALLGWLGYSAIAALGGPDEVLGALLNDTFVALTAEGLMGALIALLPLRFLDGRDLFEASKPLWAAAFVGVGLAFALLVLPTAMEGTEVRDLGVWVIVFGAFTVVAFVIWAIFARRGGDTDADADEPEHEAKHLATR